MVGMGTPHPLLNPSSPARVALALSLKQPSALSPAVPGRGGLRLWSEHCDKTACLPVCPGGT